MNRPRICAVCSIQSQSFKNLGLISTAHADNVYPREEMYGTSRWADQPGAVVNRTFILISPYRFQPVIDLFWLISTPLTHAAPLVVLYPGLRLGFSRRDFARCNLYSGSIIYL